MAMELIERIERTARREPSKPAYIHVANGQTLSYGQLAQSLRGPRAGGRLVLHGGNELALAPLLLRLIGGGADVLAVGRATPAGQCMELAQRIGGSGVFPEQRWESLLRDDRPLAALSQSPGGGALLLATSGSTGSSRVVRRTAASLDAMARAVADAIGMNGDDRVLMMLPLAHSYAVEHGLLGPLWAGATVLLCGGLDPAEMAAALKLGASVFPAVPSIIEMLSADDSTEVKFPVSQIRKIYSAGGFLPPAVCERFSVRHGAAVGQLYGATEIGSVTYRPAAGNDTRNVGTPMPGVSVRILRQEDSIQQAEAGESGEVAIRSPFMLSEYADDSAEPSRLIDGHFRTGDLGLLKDGQLHITGRIKFLIDAGNSKVNPIEVEEVIAAFPGVRECLVVHLPQTQTVSRLKAIVVAQPSLDTTALRQFLRGKLAAHKVPREIELRAELPRSATGKVLRHLVGGA
jgi:acyl-CoA synthetase (AMP-forming)/AMP-acid ligase II